MTDFGSRMVFRLSGEAEPFRITRRPSRVAAAADPGVAATSKPLALAAGQFHDRTSGRAVLVA
ncbi:hypothetical protein [Microtetraspora malaysiensis]|uniref:Uncharacterized protein n=1 Tax=Microtetraspora malaysiensis TaxID=161358 RepID=A0ABW6T1C2_9ACTN